MRRVCIFLESNVELKALRYHINSILYNLSYPISISIHYFEKPFFIPLSQQVSKLGFGSMSFSGVYNGPLPNEDGISLANANQVLLGKATISLHPCLKF